MHSLNIFKGTYVFMEEGRLYFNISGERSVNFTKKATLGSGKCNLLKFIYFCS